MTSVSIITPFYNPKPEDIDRSKVSISTQTSRDFEWILVDDGSTNGLVEGDVSLGRNYGPSVARNAGFQISRGKIITYMDMGDELSPMRVANLIKQFDDFDIDLLFSAYFIYQRGHFYPVNHLDLIGHEKRFPDALEYSKQLQRTNLSIPLGVAHTRRPFVLAGGFQRGIVCGEDGILWRRMCDNLPGNKIMFSDDVAGSYFPSSDGQSRTQRRFEMGGFAFNGALNDNGKYLDEQWFKEFSSEELYD